MKWIALIVILVSCFFDPLQQVLLKGRYEGTVGWWHFHLVHFAAFYPPLIWIVLREYWPWIRWDGRLSNVKWWWRLNWNRILTIAGITVLAWATWQAGMLVSGAGWESWIVRMAKGWF